MDVLEKALSMLSKYPLCDHCLGRQFALLGYSIENNDRGKALKLGLTLQASDLNATENAGGVKQRHCNSRNIGSVKKWHALQW